MKFWRGLKKTRKHAMEPVALRLGNLAARALVRTAQAVGTVTGSEVEMGKAKVLA